MQDLRNKGAQELRLMVTCGYGREGLAPVVLEDLGMTLTLKDRNGTTVASGRRAIVAYINAHCADGAVVIVRTKGARDGDYSIRAIRADRWVAEVCGG